MYNFFFFFFLYTVKVTKRVMYPLLYEAYDYILICEASRLDTQNFCAIIFLLRTVVSSFSRRILYAPSVFFLQKKRQGPKKTMHCRAFLCFFARKASWSFWHKPCFYYNPREMITHLPGIIHKRYIDHHFVKKTFFILLHACKNHPSNEKKKRVRKGP